MHNKQENTLTKSWFSVLENLCDQQAVRDEKGRRERNGDSIEELKVLEGNLVIVGVFRWSISVKVAHRHLNSLYK